MTSWREILRQRQIAIDAADREELEAQKKYISLSDVDCDNIYSDASRRDKFSSSPTEAAAELLIGTDIQAAQSVVLENLQDMCQCPVLERHTAYSSDVEYPSTDYRETASADSGVVDIIQQSSPASADLTDELKYDVEDAPDGDCIESDQISSSVIDSSLSCYQPSVSLPSTPEHLISDAASPAHSALNGTSDGSETHSVDEVPEPFAKATVPVGLAVDIQSPDHKRTRRHGRKHGTRGKRKHVRAQERVETTPANDVMNLQQELGAEFSDHWSQPVDPTTSLSKQSELELLPSRSYSRIQHFDVVPDAKVTEDSAAYVARQASYLNAVDIGTENTKVPQQQHNSTNLADSAVSQILKDQLSANELLANTGSK